VTTPSHRPGANRLVIVILSACDACTTLSQSVLHQGMRGSIGHRLFTVWSSHRCFKNSLSRLDCKSSRVIDRAASRRRRGRSPVLPGSPAIDAPARWIHVVSALPAAWPRQRSTLAAARRVDPVDIGKQAGMRRWLGQELCCHSQPCRSCDSRASTTSSPGQRHRGGGAGGLKDAQYQAELLGALPVQIDTYLIRLPTLLS
jgi:hypothetical protein